MRVETVRGAMAVDGLGTTLMHEHVFVVAPDVMQNYGHEWRRERFQRRGRIRTACRTRRRGSRGDRRSR